MSRCVARRCRSKVEPGWIFCAYCGTDNRPRAFQPPILTCPHLFYEQESYCLRCGVSRDRRPTAAQRDKQLAIGKNLITLGILLAIVAMGISQVHLNHLPGNEYIKAQYEETYSSDGRPLMRGDQYVAGGEITAALFTGIGCFALVVANVNGRRRRS